MSRASLLCRVVAVSAIGVGTGGCTVVKPLVGAFYGPAVMLGSTTGGLGCSCGSGEGIVIVLAIMAAIGATGGLVTGIISDAQIVFGDVEEPSRNWNDPFRTNTSPVAEH